MNVTVLLFASYADALGTAEIELALPPGSTVADAVRQVGTLPGAERVPPSPLVAVNERYASLDRELAAGDQLALIPPVAGG
jgi:molybdopterin converting factor small subunit